MSPLADTPVKAATAEIDEPHTPDSQTDSTSNEERFFESISAEGYPSSAEDVGKVRPWQELREGTSSPTEDKKLVVACPKDIIYGRSRWRLDWLGRLRVRG